MEATVHTKTNDLQEMEQERSVLRWGGLAGMLGSVLMVVTFVFVPVFVTVETSAAYLIENFPEMRVGRTIENSLFLAVPILWVPSFLALYRALRGLSITRTKTPVKDCKLHAIRANQVSSRAISGPRTVVLSQ